MDREIRTMCHEVRAAPDAGGEPAFEGYAAVFDTWSEDLGGFREKIARGAFSKALERGDDVRALFNHDPNYVLGRTKAGTLELTEDENGLRFRVQLPSDIGWARDLYRSVQRGDISQCSFAFMVEDEDWARGQSGDERTIRSARLFDVSIVTYPAYEATSVQARCRKEKSAGNAIRRMRLALKEKAGRPFRA